MPKASSRLSKNSSSATSGLRVRSNGRPKSLPITESVRRRWLQGSDNRPRPRKLASRTASVMLSAQVWSRPISSGPTKPTTSPTNSGLPSVRWYRVSTSRTLGHLVRERMNRRHLNPAPVPGLRLYDEECNILWETCAELGVPIGLHPSASHPFDAGLLDYLPGLRNCRTTVSFVMGSMLACTAFIMGGAPEAFPNA